MKFNYKNFKFKFKLDVLRKNQRKENLIEKR